MSLLSLFITIFFITVTLAFYMQGQTKVQKKQAAITCESKELKEDSDGYKTCIEAEANKSPLKRGEELKQQARDVRNLMNTIQKEMQHNLQNIK